jgi:hypothetical protein
MKYQWLAANVGYNGVMAMVSVSALMAKSNAKAKISGIKVAALIGVWHRKHQRNGENGGSINGISVIKIHGVSSYCINNGENIILWLAFSYTANHQLASAKKWLINVIGNIILSKPVSNEISMANGVSIANENQYQWRQYRRINNVSNGNNRGNVNNGNGVMA